MSYWDDRVVLVTGSSSGLGRMIAGAFGDAGTKIVIVGLEPEGVEQTADEFTKNGVDTLGIAADITDQADVDRMIQQVIDRFGRLDVLVNNAGRTMRGKFMDTPPELFESLIKLNFTAMVRCTQAAVPHLLKQRGHVVNIGSLAAKAASRWTGAYPASKHAVAAISQQMRLELGPEGLHTLLVCPGPIKRDDPRLYVLEGVDGIPDRAMQPGAGVRIRGVDPKRLAQNILNACEHRRPEIVMPWKSRILFAIQQLSPRLGDWLVLKNT